MGRIKDLTEGIIGDGIYFVVDSADGTKKIDSGAIIGVLQPKSDDNLSTISHTIVGAINEINDWSLAVVDGELCIKYEEA